jgi:hypothetical protein
MTGTTITLRGIEVELTSDLGRAFTISACQAAEGLIEDSELAEAYELTPEDLQKLAANKALGRAIKSELARRVNLGIAARQAAAKEFATAPKVLGKLLRGDVHPKHAVDIHRELRATVSGAEGERAADTEKFTIIINMGADSEVYEKERLPMKPLVPVIEDKTDE